jgi:hypothetical protein
MTTVTVDSDELRRLCTIEVAAENAVKYNADPYWLDRLAQALNGGTNPPATVAALPGGVNIHPHRR